MIFKLISNINLYKNIISYLIPIFEILFLLNKSKSKYIYYILYNLENIINILELSNYYNIIKMIIIV